MARKRKNRKKSPPRTRRGTSQKEKGGEFPVKIVLLVAALLIAGACLFELRENRGSDSPQRRSAESKKKVSALKPKRSKTEEDRTAITKPLPPLKSVRGSAKDLGPAMDSIFGR